MPLSRVSIALSQGLFELPDGCVVHNAPGDIDLGLNLSASQAFAPEFARLKARGISVTPMPEGSHLASLVQCHRSRAMTFHLLWHAVENTEAGGLIVVNGAKTDGIEAIVREIKKRFEVEDVFSKAHGKVVWFRKPAKNGQVDHWQAKQIAISGNFVSFPGIFSSDGPDQGSVILTKHLPALKGRVADLGSGWGFLSRAILNCEAVTSLDMIEADFYAAEMGKLNVTDSRASHNWADALAFDGKGYDTVVMNPPFHTSRKPDPALGQAFIRKAASILTPRGELWMVANRNLPYEAELEQNFQLIKTVAQTGGFKVVHAKKPQNSRKPR